jgi:lipid-A-disaccharide synthase-like uncharacterized protein
VGPWDYFAFVGNALFFSRFLVQWIESEKAGRSVAPRVFWWLSMAAAVIFTAYMWHEGEEALMFTFLATTLIYIRNLFLTGKESRTLGPIPALIVAAAVVWLVFQGLQSASPKPGTEELSDVWKNVAFVGAVLWASRFVLQWWLSERKGVSHFPTSFWIVSLMGNALLLPYAIKIDNVPVILGMSFSPIVQVRNLVLALRANKTDVNESSRHAD